MTETVTLRKAVLGDLDEIAELHVRTFRETHGGGPSVELRKAQWSEALKRPREFCVVLEDMSAGRLVGFARGTLHDKKDGLAYDGELNKIYLLREFQGRGLGRRLICAVATEFQNRGIPSMLLFGDARSRSNGFYERMGAQRLLSPEGEFHGCYGWPRLDALTGECGSEQGASS